MAARVAPHAEKTVEQLRAEITHLNQAIAALERYAAMTMGTVPPVKLRRASKNGRPSKRA